MLRQRGIIEGREEAGRAEARASRAPPVDVRSAYELFAKTMQAFDARRAREGR